MRQVRPIPDDERQAPRAPRGRSSSGAAPGGRPATGLWRGPGGAIACVTILTALLGCGQVPTPEVGPGASSASPQRIVCGTPAITEIVFALGCADRVVGVSDYGTYPPEAQSKERIGGWMNPNRERLLLLQPDLILSQGRHESLAGFCESRGIRFHTVALDTIDDLYEAIDTMSAALGVAERGDRLSAEIRTALHRVRQRVARRPTRRVLFLFGHAPGQLTKLGSVGPGTFVDQLITIAGGSNIFSDARGAYPQISTEAILLREPEVILESSQNGIRDESAAQLRADWQRLPMLPAVRDGRIEMLSDDYLLILGPRVALSAERLARAIHPEAFDE